MKIYRYILIQNNTKCYDIDTCWAIEEDDPLIDAAIQTYNDYVKSYFILSNRGLFQFCYESQLWNYSITTLELKEELKPYLWITWDDKYPFYVNRPYFFKSELEFEQRIQTFYELYGYNLKSKILYRAPFQKPVSKKREKKL